MYNYNVYNNELYHYGVIGMKWGVRKGNVAKAYTKAVAKKDKLNAKADKLERKHQKAEIKANSGASAKYQKYSTKAAKYQTKALKKSTGLFKNTDKNKRAAGKYLVKANKYEKKAGKYKHKFEKRQTVASISKGKMLKAQRKAQKWEKAMDKTFRGMDVSTLSESTVNAGREYING